MYAFHSTPNGKKWPILLSIDETNFDSDFQNCEAQKNSLIVNCDWNFWKFASGFAMDSRFTVAKQLATFFCQIDEFFWQAGSQWILGTPLQPR